MHCLRRKAADFRLVLTIKPTRKDWTGVQDRVSSDIGALALPLDWNTIDRETATRKVKNLRQRIYRATQEGQ